MHDHTELVVMKVWLNMTWMVNMNMLKVGRAHGRVELGMLKEEFMVELS
ncbi:hypothetical protein A2U01_0070782 [Trifolium medium]|uniref:Uncharacterized protein n=1 Tax=Trifolium medium TaxID=97028 RepID=A0A392SKX5_9FABA|nr:hypothetical protein [Trifolium medium]